MRLAGTSLILLVLAGCDTFNKVKVDNPVMGPPPPRIGRNDADSYGTTIVDGERSALGESDAVQTVDFSENHRDGELASEIVATVNGEPVFDSDLIAFALMESWGQTLVEMHRAHKAGQLPTNIYQTRRRELVQMLVTQQEGLSPIPVLLLAQALRPMLQADQIASVESQLRAAFNTEVVPKLQKRLGVESRPELEREMREYGTSLLAAEKSFIQKQAGYQYLEQKRGRQTEPSRRELLAYYEEHRENYAHKARVRWQQILVSFRKHGSRQDAFAALEAAVADLKSGKKSFADVARDHSDGPTATKGGEWDWTNEGSLADTQVEESLFTMPVGQISGIIENTTSFQLVKVIEREDATYTPFEELQTTIADEIKAKARHESAKVLVDELRAQAVIETKYDKQAPGAARLSP